MDIIWKKNSIDFVQKIADEIKKNRMEEFTKNNYWKVNKPWIEKNSGNNVNWIKMMIKGILII